MKPQTTKAGLRVAKRGGMTAKELSAYLDRPVWQIEEALQRLIKRGLVQNV